ncbi:MAG: G5 domain-containing protein [Clostridia bacterium]|nr:G5 domain-containing protein [Clostridia bacterium]
MADQRKRAYSDTRTQTAVRPGVNPGGNTEQFRRINGERTAEFRRTQNSQTASIPAQRSNSGTARPASAQRNSRTGSVPYINNSVQNRGTSARRKRKAPLYIRVLAWLYRYRKAVVACMAVCLFFSITIPLAVYAASSEGGAKSVDFEILSTAPSGDNMISADLSGGAFDADLPDVSDTKGEAADTDEPEAEDSDAAETVVEDDSSADTADGEASSDTSALQSDDEPVQIDPEDTVPQFYVTIGFYDREAITCLTAPATLGEILYNAGYTLRETDRPTVSPDEMIEGESWIMIDSVTYETVTVSEAIPFEVDTVEVQTVPRGTTRTVTPGVYGSREKVYTVQYVNGAEIERNFEYEYVSQYPQNQVDYYGVGGTVYASDGSSYSYSYYMDVRATYYNIHGNTASGLPTSNSVMAVDPSVIPLGTYVYVMSDYYDMGVKIAADTGGAVKGNIIDIWMDENHPHYYEFANQGVANMRAYILD